MSNITFSDHEFRNSHGRAPRGRGLWAFRLASAKTTYIAYIDDTFSKARRQAIRYAKEKTPTASTCFRNKPRT